MSSRRLDVHETGHEAKASERHCARWWIDIAHEILPPRLACLSLHRDGSRERHVRVRGLSGRHFVRHRLVDFLREIDSQAGEAVGKEVSAKVMRGVIRKRLS